MHTVYRNAKRETTEWDDAQRRIGNLPPLPAEELPEAWAPKDEPRGVTADALRAAPAAALAAADGCDDDRALEQLRCATQPRPNNSMHAACLRPVRAGAVTYY